MKREYLVSAKEMKQYDTNTIEKIQIPAAVLMERAAFAVAMEVLEQLKGKKQAKVLVICGNGNNGADGVCAGRILMEYGIVADVCLMQSGHPYTEELQRQLNIAQHYKLSYVNETEIKKNSYDLIVDAIFGIGLNREISGSVKELIEYVNCLGIPIVSVDIPSGIDATSGKVLGSAVKATVTVTFGFYKRGQLFYPGRAYCGTLKKAKVAINETGFGGMAPRMFSYMETEQHKSVGDFRNPMGNKGTFGKVFVIAGRASTTGAALLCSKSALRSGCGMVSVFTEKENKNAFLENLPEAMIETYVENELEESLAGKMQKWIKWADVIVVGCGLGRDETAYYILKEILRIEDKPIVCDADALQLIADKSELRDLVRNRKKEENALVFTPHPGELAALAQCSVAEVKANRINVIAGVLKEYPVIMVAKDADTLVCCKEHDSYLNATGNDGLSTAGSGDVLAGLVASLIAQTKGNGMEVFEAVCKSVYYHGKAADVLAKENGKSFLVASDLIKAYKYILK